MFSLHVETRTLRAVRRAQRGDTPAARVVSQHLQLDEAVAECARQNLASAVRSRWVLCGEEHEVLMRSNRLVGLRDEQLAVVI